MNKRFRRNDKIEESPLQGDLMLFDPVKSQFFVLNPTMAFLWHNCDGEKGFDQIVNLVPEEFTAVDGRPVAAEMKIALEELVKLGLVSAD